MIENSVPKFVLPSAAQTNAVHVADFARTHQLARTSTVFCVHTDCPDMVLTTLLDSGASHSCISPRAVEELGLTITPPKGDVKEIRLADGKTVIQRIGTVVLDLHIFFLHMDKEQPPQRMRIGCEVMPCFTDLILGVNALRILFPNDHLTNFFIPPSVLASVPIPLTVEYDYDSSLGTISRFFVRPEGHLTRSSRRQNLDVLVAALDIMEEVTAHRVLHPQPLEEAATQSGTHNE